MHLAQNVYIAKTKQKLFEEELYAYANGGVILEIQKNYSSLWNNRHIPILPVETANFLDKIYYILENAPLDELIEISHEDTEWESKHIGHTKEEQRMDTLSHVAEYQSQYADVIELMEHIDL